MADELTPDQKKLKLAENIAASPSWLSVRVAALFGTVSTALLAWLATVPIDQQVAFVTGLLSKYSWGLPLVPVVGFLIRYWARVHPQSPPAVAPGEQTSDPKQSGRITTPAMLGLALAAVLLVAGVGCTPPLNPDGTQLTAAQVRAKYTADITQARGLVDQATLDATALIKQDLLKGKDADNVIATIKVAKDGLALTDQLVGAGTLTQAQGSSRVNITIAALTAAQGYFALMASNQTPPMTAVPAASGSTK